MPFMWTHHLLKSFLRLFLSFLLYANICVLGGYHLKEVVYIKTFGFQILFVKGFFLYFFFFHIPPKLEYISAHDDWCQETAILFGESHSSMPGLSPNEVSPSLYIIFLFYFYFKKDFILREREREGERERERNVNV